MKKILFGLKPEQYTQNDSKDFVEFAQQNETDNNNPYGGSFFSDPRNMPQPNKDAERRITSIPSPYARMHLTDLAFEELAMHELDTRNISNDYIKAMSHCLDMFELFFRFDQLDLLEKGIKVERSELVSGRLGNVNKWSAFLEAHDNVRQYIETLDLFRLQYLKVIAAANNANFKFYFTDLYLFKDQQGRTFGSTSPFTGFFSTADCDLTGIGLTYEKNGRTNKLLTANPQDWRMLDQRSREFQDFMYILLNPDQRQGGLGNIFKNLFAVVQATVKDRENELKSKNFFEQYPQYNFTDEPLPRIKTPDNSILYLRSSEFDRSYMKYMLFFRQEEPVNFAIDKALYEVPVADRKFPDGTDHSCPWVGVNDFLSDALFVLPYDINSDYVGIEYEDDSNKKKYRRCLVPIKSSALKYIPDLLKPENARDRISIRKYSDGHYTVSLKIDIVIGDDQRTQVAVRREYWPEKYDDKLRIKGRVYEPAELDNFAFGIYPFVKSLDEINIYKVLFYNQLKGKVSDESLNMKFFYFDANDRITEYTFDAHSGCARNYTSEYNPSRNINKNTIYYNIESSNVNQGIDFVEFSIADEDISKEERISGTSLIIPILPTTEAAQVGQGGEETKIAIDLGTSNTYIAYRHGNGPISELNMVDGHNKAELRFMHEPAATPFILDERYTHDLCLRPSDASAKQAKSDEEIKSLWLNNVSTQLCEFIPTHIMENKPENLHKAFTFPIPTLISPLRYNGSNETSNLALNQNKPLVHSTIPFAYYEIGKRKFDAPRGDFKWFVDLQTGLETTHGEKEALTLFVSELLFLIRSHMLYNGYSLRQCKIIWTYPLAFKDELRDYTETIWQEQYLRYFRNDGQAYIGQPNRYPEISNYVLHTNESLSPFYYCRRHVGADNAYQLLVDIGGGSSDIMGFKQSSPQFISSFHFAGNDLYLYKSNTGANIVAKCINTVCQQIQEEMTKTDFKDTIRISNTDINSSQGLTSLMNYGFQKFPQQFNLIWSNPKLKYLLKFHCAAILYQTAQLCKALQPDEIPNYIHLTGNGSKLFRLLNEKERKMLVNGVFAAVMGKKQDEVRIQISDVSNPKFAAAQGCLEGYDSIFNRNAQAIDIEEKSYIALGDGNTFKRMSGTIITRNDGIGDVEYKKGVRKNVVSFIDLFYDLLSGEHHEVTKEDLINYLKMDVDNDPNIALNGTMRNLFFEYINDLMVGISANLYHKD